MKSILILGASGFLGHQCTILLKSLNYIVHTSDKKGHVDFFGDLSDEIFVKTLPFTDVVINCAAVQYVSDDLPFFGRKVYFEKNNVETARNLANHYIDKDIHFIHIGTSMMYCQDGSPYYSIQSPMIASGVYSESKLSAQLLINQLPRVATVMPCIIGGVGREGLFRGFVNSLFKFQIAIFPGPGNNKIGMIHVEDVATLILRIIETGSLGFYNAAAEDALTIREWIDEISDELKLSRILKISLPLLPIQLISQIINYRILAREQLLMLNISHVLEITESKSIGWSPLFSSKKIVRDIAKYITSHKK